MKVNIVFLFGVLILTSCNADEVPVITGNEIEFKSTCNTECSVSTFIDRNRQIIWQETTEFTNNFDYTYTAELEVGDKVFMFVMPLDGKVHIIKTEIFIDGVLQANQSKVCHAGGGCSYELE